jgi:hypothetical protein
MQFRWAGARVEVITTKRGNLRMNAGEEMELHAAQTHSFPRIAGEGRDGGIGKSDFLHTCAHRPHPGLPLSPGEGARFLSLFAGTQLPRGLIRAAAVA